MRPVQIALVVVMLTTLWVGFGHPAPLSIRGAVLLTTTGVIALVWFGLLLRKGRR